MENRAEIRINRNQVIKNFSLFITDKPKNLSFTAVVKNKGLGLGLKYLAKTAQDFGAKYVGVAGMEELALLDDIKVPILVFGQRSQSDLQEIASLDCKVQIQIQSYQTALEFARICRAKNKLAKVHFKVDTGLARYGFRWDQAKSEFLRLLEIDNLKIMGVMTHFAMSDEEDKSYANLQWQRFKQFLDSLPAKALSECVVHSCNSGGYLDLPKYHADMCRLGMLLTGNYPSRVCRRININGETLKPPVSVVSKIAFIRQLKVGDFVGYGMHFKAEKDMLIGIVPVGYGDGYPRMRNKGQVIVGNQKVNILGGIAMDTMMVDLSNVHDTKINDEVLLIGQKNKLSIQAYELAKQANTAPYQILTAWQPRMEIKYI